MGFDELPMSPVIRDEVYRIAREAVVNAFRHAEAANIEVEIAYRPRDLRLFVRDDGRGIDGPVSDAAGDSHWGIVGMRERARAIGAELKIRSLASAGTEVELVVPGHLVFARDTRRPAWWSGNWFHPRADAQTGESEKRQ